MSNIVRNLALHADIVRNLHLEGIIVPTTGITEKAIRIFHSILGMDVSNPLITSAKSSRFFVPGLSFNEDKAGNPLHLVIILLSFGLLLINRRLPQRRRLWIYGLTTTGTFLLFCQLLTWSTSRCRLHLPIFILFAALVGTVLGNSLNRRVTNGLTVLLVLLSFQWVFHNQVRPLSGENSIFATSRTSQYFTTQPRLEEIYINATNEIKQHTCSSIGLAFENLSFEYPYWPLLNAPRAGFEMHHVSVTNQSEPLVNKTPYAAFQPCLVMKATSRESDTPLESEIKVGEQVYQEFWQQTENSKGDEQVVQLFAAK